MTLTLLLAMLLMAEPPSMKDKKDDKGGAPATDKDGRIIDYRQKIMEIYERDQDARAEAEQMFRNKPAGSVLSQTEQAQIAKLAKLSRENVAQMRKLMDKYGFPGFRKVGRDVTAMACMIVQNVDKDVGFQKKFLDEMKKASETGDADGTDVAMLTDRILVAEGKKQ